MPWALAVRRPGSCGPCADGSTGWRDRHGSACAGGSRAPCDGDGCSAGTYACSRLFLRRFRGMSTPHGVSAGRSTGTARPRGRRVADRGHAAPVDWERPANGTRRAKWGSNPRAAPAGRPVDDVLLHASPRCYVRGLRGPSRPRSDHRPARHVIWVTDSEKLPVTCGNAGRITSRSGAWRSDPLIGPGSSQLVDNSVEASPVPIGGAVCRRPDPEQHTRTTTWWKRRRSRWTTSR